MIIHLNGWPGVGKLTIARAVSARLGGHLLDNHTIYNVAFALTEFRSREFYSLVRSVRDAAFARVAAISPEIPVIMTNAYGSSEWGRENWTELLSLARHRGSEFFAVTITCSPDEHLRRITAEDRRHLRKLTDPNALPQPLKPLMEDGAEHLLKLETSGIQPEESADRICQWIGRIRGGG